jgi:alkylation response protein AidB-like acyl-CoA dehydrogenase
MQKATCQTVAPHLNDWEEASEFPHALYQRATDVGWLRLGYPEALGGTPAPGARHGSVALQQQMIPDVLAAGRLHHLRHAC